MDSYIASAVFLAVLSLPVMSWVIKGRGTAFLWSSRAVWFAAPQLGVCIFLLGFPFRVPYKAIWMLFWSEGYYIFL